MKENGVESISGGKSAAAMWHRQTSKPANARRISMTA